MFKELKVVVMVTHNAEKTLIQASDELLSQKIVTAIQSSLVSPLNEIRKGYSDVQ